MADTTYMRIVRKQPKEKLQPVTVQLRPSVLKLLDEAAKKVDVSRQKLLGAILERVLTDKNFVLELED